MNTKSMTGFIDKDTSETTTSFLEKHIQASSSEKRAKAGVPHFLVTMYKGIGDAVMVGLSAIDQIIKDDPEANGKIDVLFRERAERADIFYTWHCQGNLQPERQKFVRSRSSTPVNRSDYQPTSPFIRTSVSIMR